MTPLQKAEFLELLLVKVDGFSTFFAVFFEVGISDFTVNECVVVSGNNLPFCNIFQSTASGSSLVC